MSATLDVQDNIWFESVWALLSNPEIFDDLRSSNLLLISNIPRVAIGRLDSGCAAASRTDSDYADSWLHM